MQAAFKPNPRALADYRAAMEELASVLKRRDAEGLQKLLTQSAKRFVKNVADVTPPSSGKADLAAKKAGEEAVLADLLRIATPVVGLSRTHARELLASAEDLLALHARSRAPETGRVNPRNRKEKLLVTQSSFLQAVKVLQSRVGWLAAALNASASKLGFRLPAWISRHGNKYGAIDVSFTATRLAIRIVQNVPFADNVSGYRRRWEFAFQKEIKAIRGQIKVVGEKALARARAKFR